MIPVLHLNCTKIPFSRVHALLSDRNKYILIHLHRLKLNVCTCLCMSTYSTAGMSLCPYVYMHTESILAQVYLILNIVVSR